MWLGEVRHGMVWHVVVRHPQGLSGCVSYTGVITMKDELLERVEKLEKLTQRCLCFRYS